MNKFVYFLAVGLAFTALQVTTVEASHDRAHVDEMRAMEDQTRQTMRETEDQMRQTTRETEDQTRQTAREAEDRALDEAEEARNSAAGAAGAPECPEGTECGPPPCPEGTTCEGMDHHPMMDPRTDPPMPFSPADEATYQVYADECESSGGTISEASMAILITPPHNFTRGQVEGLCQESAHDDHPDCETMGAPGSAARTACEAGGAN